MTLELSELRVEQQGDSVEVPLEDESARWVVATEVTSEPSPSGAANGPSPRTTAARFEVD